MKKKITVILLTITLLTGCEATPATVPAITNPDIETIVQQSVAEAIAQYEEIQKEKDAEIVELKAQLKELTSQAEEAPDTIDPPETAPAEEAPAPASSQPEEPKTQPEPELEEPEPQSEPEESAPAQSAVSSSRYDGFDLRNMYPAFVWENFQPIEGDQSSDDVWVPEYEDEEEPQNTSGFLREDDAWMVTQLINQERENHGLDTLLVDDDLMEVAAVRAVELWEGEYSHQRRNYQWTNSWRRTVLHRQYRGRFLHRRYIEWSEMLDYLDALNRHMEIQTSYLKQLSERPVQYPTQTQMDKMLKRTAHLEQMVEQAGSQKEKSFSLPKIKLPSLCLPDLDGPTWAFLLMFLAALFLLWWCCHNVWMIPR